MNFRITYEQQIVSTDLDIEQAVRLHRELTEEAIADDCEPLYVVELQIESVVLEVGSDGQV